MSRLDIESVAFLSNPLAALRTISDSLNSSLEHNLTFISLKALHQVSQTGKSPLLSSPPVAAADTVKPADKPAKKRSSFEVRGFNIEFLQIFLMK